MKHIIAVNGKALETLTPAERRALDITIINAFRKHTGIIMKLDESKYSNKKSHVI